MVEHTELRDFLQSHPKLKSYVERHPRFKSFVDLVYSMVNIYNDANVPRSAAALSYFLTMSVFPVLICVHAIVASLAADITPVLESLSAFIPENTMQIIVDYLGYVGAQNNAAILTAGILATATTSAAAFRSIHYIMADIQGAPRFRGIWTLIVSFIFSLLFLAAIYFAILVMVAGNWLISLISQWIPQVSALGLWAWLRYPVLFIVFVLIINGIYRLNAPKNVKGGFFPGALSVSVLMVLVSMLFSYFVGLSSRYPLIYGSLASIIIFMIWMYFCGQILIMGNAFNVVLRSRKKAQIEEIVDANRE